jgi:hypothetical protein
MFLVQEPLFFNFKKKAPCICVLHRRILRCEYVEIVPTPWIYFVLYCPPSESNRFVLSYFSEQSKIIIMNGNDGISYRRDLIFF